MHGLFVPNLVPIQQYYFFKLALFCKSLSLSLRVEQYWKPAANAVCILLQCYCLQLMIVHSIMTTDQIAFINLSTAGVEFHNMPFPEPTPL